jgi:hypothetical protein
MPKLADFIPYLLKEGLMKQHRLGNELEQLCPHPKLAIEPPLGVDQLLG